MRRYEVQYAEGHERRMHIVEKPDDLDEETSFKEAKEDATKFLAGRKMISFHSLHLPTTVLQPKPEFISPYPAN